MSGVEDLLGGMGGEPDAEARVEDARAEIAGDGAATTIAIGQADNDPKARADADGYLRSQKTLVDLQIAHFEEQHRLTHQERLLAIDAARRKRFADRLRNGLQVFVAIGVTLAALAVLVMIHDAATARSVVVDPFAAPATLAPRGVTGQVVASGVLDQLQLLQDAARSASKGLSATNAWSSDVKIQVPDTGVSIGEIDRVLRQRLGHDVHIGGDLVQTETGGLALTVRGDGVLAKTFEGGAGDLAAITRQAAEYVYGRSQPLQLAEYLTNNNRYADALAFLPGAFARAGDDDTRAHLANSWGNAYGGLNNPTAAAAKYRLAMALKPNNWAVWGNLVEVLPGEEAQWRESKKLLRAAFSAPKRERPELRHLSNAAAIVWDLPLTLVANLQEATHNGGVGTSNSIIGPTIADSYGLMHDFASADRFMAQSDPNDPYTKAEADLLPAYAALDSGDPAAAAAPLERFWKAWLADPNLQLADPDTPCLVGLALGFSGQRTEAEAVFRRTGSWSRCYAAHGDEMEHAGDLAGALNVWAEGLRVAPDLPQVYLHRGISKFRRGDLAGAAVDLAAANRSAPHFADPLKAWGDLLARQGRWRDALAKYDEALKYAPAWPQLRQASRAARARLE